MFINKINNELNRSFGEEMSSVVNVFLKTEITCIPRLLTKIFGNYYNNGLCNGACWVFSLWCLLHALFDKVVSAFLKKLRYREYVRIRLKCSLWYLGFYGVSFVYCYKVMSHNGIEFFTLKRIYPFLNQNIYNSNIFNSITIGYVMLTTFYLHSSFWEGVIKKSFFDMLSYLLLAVFIFTSYMSGIPEVFGLSLKLTALISISQLGVEFTKCWFMSSVQESFLSKLISVMLFLITLCLYITIHLIAVPLLFLVRLGLSVMSETPSSLLIFLFFTIATWLATESYQSILFRFMNHWLYHKKEANKDVSPMENDIVCNSTLLECSLFKARDDLAYQLKLIRDDIQTRKEKMMAMRKPKASLFQTLKCMVAIKRKLSSRRLSEFDRLDSSESNESDGNKTNTVENSDDEKEESEVETVVATGENAEDTESQTVIIGDNNIDEKNAERQALLRQACNNQETDN